MAENPKLAFLQRALSVNGANAPVEETALENLVFQRLITAGMTIDSAGNITAPFVTATPNVTNATGTLPVTHGGTGVATLTGLVKGNGAAVMTAVAAPTGAVVGDTDTQTLTNKTISGASNTLTVRAASDITGQLPVANGGTGVATLTAHGVVIGEGASAVAVTTAGTAGQALVSNGASADPAFATVGVNGGGTGTTTLTAHGVVLGNGTSAVAVTAAGTAGQVLTSNGPAADPTYQGTSTLGALQFLKAGSGTDTSAGATNLDTIAITGLTAKDVLLVHYELESVTQTTSTPVLYNNTDAVTVGQLGGNAAGSNVGAGIRIGGTARIGQRQAGVTSVFCCTALARSDDLFTGAFNSAAFTTNWTGSWTLALRHGGVTAGGTCAFVWSVYKVLGQ